MQSTLKLEPGSNTTVVVAIPKKQTGVSATLMPLASQHQPLAVLIGKALGVSVEYIGNHLSSTIWAAGNARPITIRIIPSTNKLMGWYTSMGSPLGSGPIEFYALHIDWRGTPRELDWTSTAFVIPKKAEVVRGASSYENATPAELKQKVESIPPQEAMSNIMSHIDAAVDAVSTTTLAALNTVGPWILGIGLTVFGLWVGSKVRRR